MTRCCDHNLISTMSYNRLATILLFLDSSLFASAQLGSLLTPPYGQPSFGLSSLMPPVRPSWNPSSYGALTNYNSGYNPGYNPGYNTASNLGFNPNFNPGFNPLFNPLYNPVYNPSHNLNSGYNPTRYRVNRLASPANQCRADLTCKPVAHGTTLAPPVDDTTLVMTTTTEPPPETNSTVTS